ncbi:MAG TPA: DegV family protein [Caldilineae bacterium]|nr:DegV family protein [Caldilineae bacterium]
MKKLRIVTDSSAHLTQEERTSLGISVVPLRLRLGRKTYKEAVELKSDAFFNRLQTIKTLPVSYPAVLQDFIDTYYRLSQETDEILSIHISSKLTDTANVARMAAATLRGHTRITVIDSETLDRGLGMVVKCAAEAAMEGATYNEVSRLVRGIIPSIFLSFFVDDLSYLKRDGRIRDSQALLGTMLGIKPLVEIREGDLIVMEKVRDRIDMIEKLYNFISEFAYLKEIALLQNNNQQDATQLLEQLEATYPDVPIFTDRYGPTLASFIGPSAVGVVVREDF